MRYIPSLDKNFKPMINVLNEFKEKFVEYLENKK